MARIGLLTGGGDCPGLNAVIRAVVRRGLADGGHSFVGFRHGWAGVLEDDATELTLQSTAGILPRGGTILGTSRTNPFADGQDGTEPVRRTLRSRGVDALIPIGGEDTLGVALRLHREGVPIVGVPKTIDNDLGGTDVTFGFQTAVQIVTDAIDRLHTTAESHNRVMVVEVMGRHAGWIATHAGSPEERTRSSCRSGRSTSTRSSRTSRAATSAAAASRSWWWPRAPRRGRGRCRPRRDRDGRLRARAARRHRRDARGGDRAADGFETRVTILGHVQRGGTPVAFDRVLATRFGVAAMDAAAAGRFGTMVGLRGTEIVEVSLEEALREPKLLDPALYETAELFFG